MSGHDERREAQYSVPTEDLDLYAIDGLPASEEAAVEQALASAPAEQREAMLGHIVSTREIIAEMVADAGLDASPPPALRARVLDLAAREQTRLDAGETTRQPVSDLQQARRQRRRPIGIALAASAAALVLLAGGVVIGRVTDRAEDTPTAQPPTTTMPGHVSALLTAPDLVMLRGEVAAGGSATLLAARSTDMAVITMAGLPEPAEGRAYQLWLMGGDHDPIPAGTMESGQVGPSASAQLDGISDSEQIGVTEEPAGGSEAPTGEVLLVLDLT